MKVRRLHRFIPFVVATTLLGGGAVLVPAFVGVAGAIPIWPELSIADAAVVEGTGFGITTINLVVTTTELYPEDCGYRVVLTHVTTSDADFVGTGFDVTAVWDTDDQDISRSYVITRDATDEPDETFTVALLPDELHNVPCVIDDGEATGTINDDDLPLQPLSIADASVTEGTGAGSTAISLILTSPALQPSVCVYQVALTHGSSSDADFTETTFIYSAVWDQDDANIPRTFQIAQDAIDEGDETFTVTITGDNISGNACPIADGVATGTIIDDDGPAPTTAPPTTAPPTTVPATIGSVAPPHATPTTASTSSGGTIPETGSFAAETLRTALALLVVGGSLLLAVRRRWGRAA